MLEKGQLAWGWQLHGVMHCQLHASWQQGSGGAFMRSAAPACMLIGHAAGLLACGGVDMLGTATRGAGLSSGGSAVARPPPGPKHHVPGRHSLCAAVSACAAAPLRAAPPRPLPAPRPAQQRQRRSVQDPGPGPPGPFQQQMCKVHRCLAAPHVITYICLWCHGATVGLDVLGVSMLHLG